MSEINETVETTTEEVVTADENTNEENISESDMDFMDDESIDELKMLNLLSKRKDIQNMKDNIRKEQHKFMADENAGELLEAKLESIPIVELKAMTDEQIAELYTINGEEFKLSIDFGNNDKKEREFKRDFAVFLKNSSITMKQFDEETDKIEKEINENQEEFDRVVSEFGNVSNLIRTKLAENMEKTTDESKKKLYAAMIEEYDYGFTLNNVKKYYSSHRAGRVLGDYKDDKRSNYLYRKYKRVIDALKIKTDLTSFVNLEAKFLSEDHQKHPNIFIFSIISMVASWEKNIDANKGLFLTQFTINIKNLFYNKFDTEEERAKFIANIIDVMDLID